MWMVDEYKRIFLPGKIKRFKAWVRNVFKSKIMIGQLYLLLYLFYQAEIFLDYKTRRPALP